MSTVELDRKADAINKLRELSNFIVGRIDTAESNTEEIQEPGKPGEKL